MLVISSSMSEQTRRPVKSVWTTPGIMYSSCKKHKTFVNGCPPFVSIYLLTNLFTQVCKISSAFFSAINYHVLQIRKLTYLSHWNYWVSFQYLHVYRRHWFFFYLHATSNELFKKKEIFHTFQKWRCIDLLSLAKKESNFIVNDIIFKQIKKVALTSSFGPSVANAFLAYYGQNCLDLCPLEYRPLYYHRHFDDIFLHFKTSDHLKRFTNYLISGHVNDSFTTETD